MLQIVFVYIIEGVVIFAVDVEDGDDFAIMTDGDYYFAFRLGGTSDVSRELVNVRHDDGLVVFPRCAADTFSKRNARASNWSLEGTKNEFFVYW